MVTVPGISMISLYDYERWGHYWSFTEQSLRKLFEEAGAEQIDITSFGNPKVASGFIYGLSQEDLGNHSFEYDEKVTPFLISARIVK